MRAGGSRPLAAAQAASLGRARVGPCPARLARISLIIGTLPSFGSVLCPVRPECEYRSKEESKRSSLQIAVIG
jgi:hypothetical protein